MKILLDPVYTQKPSICSTSYLCWELIEQLSKARQDVFFYLLYPPDGLTEDDHAFLNRYKDRVTLLPLRQSRRDRLSELFMLRNDLRFYLNPWNIHCWDWDVIMSSRIPVLKHMRVHSARQAAKAFPSYRMYVGLEEMPILSFRDTVPWCEPMQADTIMSYALTDATLINNQWTRKLLQPVLKEILAPAWQKRVNERIHEVVPVKLQRLSLAKKWDGARGESFNVCFVGRITSTRNFKGVADLFRKHFSYPIGKNKSAMRFLVSTNSDRASLEDYGEIDFIDIQIRNRPKFHQFLEEAQVAINMSPFEDFSLSTYETLLKGVPTIVSSSPWADFLGVEYPFRVANQMEAYVMLSAFVGDYTVMYNKFKDWESTYWRDYVLGEKNITTSEKALELITSFERKRRDIIQGSGIGAEYKRRLRDVGKVVENEYEIVDLGALAQETSTLYEKVEPNFSLAVGRIPNALTLKLVAQHEGWQDTNKVGVMRRPL